MCNYKAKADPSVKLRFKQNEAPPQLNIPNIDISKPPPSFNFPVPPRLAPPPLRLTASHPANLPFLYPHGQLHNPRKVPFLTASPPP